MACVRYDYSNAEAQNVTAHGPPPPFSEEVVRTRAAHFPSSLLSIAKDLVKVKTAQALARRLFSVSASFGQALEPFTTDRGATLVPTRHRRHGY